MKTLSVSFGAALFLLAGAGAASAQSNDQCYQIAAILCGDEGLAPCMTRPGMMSQLPPKCVGEFQAMVDAVPKGQDDTMTGMSYGGVLRSGPGMDHSRVASLREGDHLKIIEDTGVWFNGYKWYYVGTPEGEGYHWGGIFCVNMDTLIEGIFQKC